LIDERDRPVLIDFGNALSLDATEDAKHNFFAVSRSFAAPEQYINDRARMGPWTDIYALGALVYFCLTGQRPTDASLRASGTAVTPLATLVPGLPDELLHAVDRAMDMDPARRQGSVAEFLSTLEALRPQSFSWVQALPDNGFGQRMRRVHDLVAQGVGTPRNINVMAGLLQGFWFFSQRLIWPGVAASLFVLALVAVGLWWRVLPIALPVAWLLAALPCAWYADWLQYRRVATLGASLPLGGPAQQQQARELLAAAGTPSALSMLIGFVPALLGLLMWGLVSDYEEDVRWRVRQAVALDDLRGRVAAYIAENKVPPQTLKDVGATFVPNSEVSHLELKGAVIELVLGVRGAADRRVRWRLDPDRGWVCEARDLQPQYTPPGCKAAQ
ncbi:MAG: serine/threonine protein kinase, partial [Aquabacterium sp.]